MLPELHALNKYRLTHDLTWQELADRIRKTTRQPMNPRTLHHAATFQQSTRNKKKSHHRGTLQDRTLFKIQRFLRLKGIAVRPRKARPVAAAAMDTAVMS